MNPVTVAIGLSISQLQGTNCTVMCLPNDRQVEIIFRVQDVRKKIGWRFESVIAKTTDDLVSIAKSSHWFSDAPLKLSLIHI